MVKPHIKVNRKHTYRIHSAVLRASSIHSYRYKELELVVSNRIHAIASRVNIKMLEYFGV